MSVQSAFESDDLVVFARRDGVHKIAVVSETYNSDEDDDDASQSSKLEPGYMSVNFYPSGRDKKVNESKVVLADRHFNMGELVVRRSAPGKVGCVVNSKLIGDLLVLPHMDTVVRNIDISKVAFVSQFDVCATTCFLLYGNWAGELTGCTHKYLLKCVPFGFRGWIKSTEMKNVKDLTSMREDNGAFDQGQFYPNQIISVPYDALKTVDWLDGFKPPPKTCTRFRMQSKRMECIVETFMIECVTVNWKTQIAGDAAHRTDKPDNNIMGEEIKKLQILDSFAHLSAGVGDRFVAHFENKDIKNILAFTDWPKVVSNLYKSTKDGSKNVGAAGDNEPETVVADSQSDPSDDVDEESDSDATFYTASETSKDLDSESLANECGASPPKKSKSDPNKSNTQPKKKVSLVDRRKGKKLGLYKRKHVRKGAKCGTVVPVGKVYIGELIMTRTSVDVLWEDGTVEMSIPARQLSFFEEDLEQCQHQIVPGSFVALKEDDSSWPSPGYGMVLSIDGHNRTAQVAIVDLSVENMPIMMGINKISLLDIKEHPDYHLHIGDIVIRIGYRTSDKAVDNVGQVISLLTTHVGRVQVRWQSGSSTFEYPCHVTSVFAYDDWEGGDDSDWTDMEVDEHSANMDSTAVDFQKIALYNVLQGGEGVSTEDSDEMPAAVDANRSSGSQDVLISTSYMTGTLEVLESAPKDHKLYDQMLDSTHVDRSFMKAVQYEHKILDSSLPPNVHVRAYEDRLDLFSCMMEGPECTPYYGGLFFFDTCLPQNYPNTPPHIYYKSYCCERLNPNLYEDGTVCLSLLGTWSGESASENWNANDSNLLQVFVSINGLVLNSEPYFNEAGYETRRTLAESAEKCRRYNETAVVRNLQSLAHIATNPPEPFAEKIANYCKIVGPKILDYYEHLFGADPPNPGFPLLPISEGCRLAAKPHLLKLAKIINSHV